MLQKILTETDIDVLEALVNENHSARAEFLANPAMPHPNCCYPHLERGRYESALEKIAEYRASGHMDTLSFYERQTAELMLGFREKIHRFLLAVCQWHDASDPEEKRLAAQAHAQTNQALYGLPDKNTFDAILAEQISRICRKNLNDAEKAMWAELEPMLPPLPAHPEAVFRPGDELLHRFSEAASAFYEPLLRHIPTDRDEFTVQEAADITSEILRTELSEYGDIWQAVAEPGRTSAAVDQEKRRILFPADRTPNTYTRIALVKIITHEVGVHVLRAMIYQNMNLPAFSKGFPGYETIEEGIAKLMEQGVSCEYQESGIVHYITAGLAHFYGMGFRQIFEIQKRLQKLSRDASEILCYQSVQRAFRGTDVLPIYKDLVYFNGAEQVWRYTAAHIDDPQLFDRLLLSAKTNCFDAAQIQLVYEAKTGRFQNQDSLNRL